MGKFAENFNLGKHVLPPCKKPRNYYTNNYLINNIIDLSL